MPEESSIMRRFQGSDHYASVVQPLFVSRLFIKGAVCKTLSDHWMVMSDSQMVPLKPLSDL